MHVKKLNATKNILERMHSEEVNTAELPKLISQLDSLRTKHDQIEEFAQKNGYKKEATAPAKRRKKSKGD